MLDIKTVMPNKHTQLVQVLDSEYRPVSQVLRYDSSKCTVLATCKEQIDGVVNFIMRSPEKHYFIQMDLLTHNGAFFSIKTARVMYLTLEHAISNFLDGTKTDHQRLTLEQAFGITPVEI